MAQTFAYDTHTFKQTNNKSKNDAIGYELQGSTPVVSKPEFNLWDTPSAYMMTSTEDLEHWIKFQLNPPDKYKSLVQQSHKIYHQQLVNLMPMHMLPAGLPIMMNI